MKYLLFLLFFQDTLPDTLVEGHVYKIYPTKIGMTLIHIHRGGDTLYHKIIVFALKPEEGLVRIKQKKI